MNAGCPVIDLCRVMVSPASHHRSPTEQPLPLTPSNLLRKWTTPLLPKAPQPRVHASEDLVDPTTAPQRFPLEELEAAVTAWLAAIG
jgi:hypothetical protein